MKNQIKIMGASLLLAISGVSTYPAWAANSVTVNFKGNLILNPPCGITGESGGPIEVDFGDMVIRKISYTANRKLLAYTLVCDASDSTRVSIMIKGIPASFDSATTVVTSNPNVGIAFAAADEGAAIRTILINTNPILFTNKTRPDIYAYPRINGGIAVTNIAAGTFTASATLEASYP